ncbi:MAG: pyruvate, phosphate dikinase, partial [Proteobacteria bacterium]|nr:pyruvate, phosphate dikinase [Pseudomonadota bacterium]
MKKTSRIKPSNRKTSSTPIKYVYAFGEKTDGKASMRELLGGKGANLAEMAAIGLPVPPGFTISTEVCTFFYDHDRHYPAVLEKSVKQAIKQIESQLGKKFGATKNPLLVSVRSGARDSMPGMMDTILNLGLNDETVQGLAEESKNSRFAWDCYRRFIQMYGSVVMGVRAKSEEQADPFHVILDKLKQSVGVSAEHELSTTNLQELITQYKALIRRQ